MRVGAVVTVGRRFGCLLCLLQITSDREAREIREVERKDKGKDMDL